MPTGLPCCGSFETWTSFTMAQGLWDVVPGQHLPTPTEGSPCPPWVGVTADILPPCVRAGRPEEPKEGVPAQALSDLEIGWVPSPSMDPFFHLQNGLIRGDAPQSLLQL